MTDWNEDNKTMNLPRFDMVWISTEPVIDGKVNFTNIIPFCEIADGEIKEITATGVTISYEGAGTVVPHSRFSKLIEDLLEVGKITYLSVQRKETSDVIQIQLV
jgi:hypothetical protein